MSTADRVLAVAFAVVVIVLLIAWVVRSRRRGGLGPPITVAPATRRGRRRVNASYAEHGWAQPFDDDGNLLPARDRKRPDGEDGERPEAPSRTS